MKTAEEIVRRLKSAGNEKSQIEILQELNRYLLTHRICFGGVTVQPLLVEAYYSSSSFQDENCHRKPLQKNHFAKFNFHRVGYGGLDICFSDSDDFFLSLLIKCAFIYPDNGNKSEEIFSQTHIPKEITALTRMSRSEIENSPLIFEESDLAENGIVCTQRKNTPKGKYARYPLAALYISPPKLLDGIAPSLQKGCRKKFVTALYCLQNIGTECDVDARKYAKKLSASKIEDSVWDAAKLYREKFFW